MGQLAFAGQVEKRGKFRLDNDKVIVNEREYFRIDKETQVVTIRGEKVSREQLNHARIIIVETDEKGNTKKIIITGWQE
jgi:hypothetical protein